MRLHHTNQGCPFDPWSQQINLSKQPSEFLDDVSLPSPFTNIATFHNLMHQEPSFKSIYFVIDIKSLYQYLVIFKVSRNKSVN